MICPKCGAQIPDGSQFCGSCGNNIADVQSSSAQAADTTDNGSFQQGSQDNSSSLLKTVGIAAAAVVVVIILCSLLFGGSYKTPMKDTVKFVNKQSTNVKKYYTTFNGSLAGTFQYEHNKLLAKIDDSYEDWEDDIADGLEDNYDSLEDQFGSNWKISYQIKKSKKIDKDDLEDYQDALQDRADSLEDLIDYAEDNDDYSDKDIKKLTKFYKKWAKKYEKVKVKAGYTVKVKVTAKGKEDKDSETVELTILKINGEWVCTNPEQLFYSFW